MNFKDSFSKSLQNSTIFQKSIKFYYLNNSAKSVLAENIANGITNNNAATKEITINAMLVLAAFTLEEVFLL